ncbi:MAG: hypothetical protein KAX26_07665 [Anaerolineae bacterium]|nr:hypothetical protein [Anaerolineae bacterium]
MVGIKTVADTLTSVRFLLGLVLMWLGWEKGPEAIPSVTLTLLTAWVTDVLDGPLACRDPRGIHTWIGDHDLEADVTVALGGVDLPGPGRVPLSLAGRGLRAGGRGGLMALRLDPSGLGGAGAALRGDDLDSLADSAPLRAAAGDLDCPGGSCHLAAFSPAHPTRVPERDVRPFATTLIEGELRPGQI